MEPITASQLPELFAFDKDENIEFTHVFNKNHIFGMTNKRLFQLKNNKKKDTLILTINIAKHITKLFKPKIHCITKSGTTNYELSGKYMCDIVIDYINQIKEQDTNVLKERNQQIQEKYDLLLDNYTKLKRDYENLLDENDKIVQEQYKLYEKYKNNYQMSKNITQKIKNLRDELSIIKDNTLSIENETNKMKNTFNQFSELTKNYAVNIQKLMAEDISPISGQMIQETQPSS